MPLTHRQVRVYQDRADLFRPSWPEVELAGNRGQDITYGPLPDYRDVPCYRIDSQDSNLPRLPGRSMGELVMNNTSFKFPFSQEVGDGWLIALKLPSGGPDNAPEVRFFVSQGEAQDKPARGRRRANQRSLFATEVPQPGTIDFEGLYGSSFVPVEIVPS
jgi:hypothetical protein